jgi:hypothetical protein
MWWRLILTTALVGAGAGVGMWIGEAARLSVWTLGAVLSFGAVGALAGRSPSRRIGAALLTSCVCVAGIYVGSQSFAHAFNECVQRGFAHAFNECVQRGEELRNPLAQHHARTAQYPQILDELPRSTPRCRRLLKGSILRYDRSEAGYRLSFSDWLVSHEATDVQPFIAHK